MKLKFCLLLAAVFAVSFNGYTQDAVIKFESLDVTLKEVIKAIETQTDFSVFYKDDQVKDVKNITLKNKSIQIKKVLDEIFVNSKLGYKVIDKTIVITLVENLSAEKLIVAPQAQIVISGTLKDSKTGNSLPGVSIGIEGAQDGTMTDQKGDFFIKVPTTSAMLTFSLVGYQSQSIALAGKTKLSVYMAEDVRSLDEVVVVGYGVQKKKLITGATSQVKGSDIQKRNTPALLDGLKGQVPGLTITKNSAQPGDGFKVNIRGMGTIGNSAPLYIVDGVPVPDINNLNPADIESLDVLKDAASAAIYGSRASNGVILVTTKKGKAGKPTITYDGYYGLQNAAKKLDYVGAKDYLMLMEEHYKYNGIAVPDFSKLIPAYAGIANGTWDGTNWLDATANKNAPMQSHNINILGGTDQNVYSMGLTLDDQEGIAGKPATPRYKRISFRMNSEFTLIKRNNTDILKVGENFNYNNIERHVTIGEGAGNETSYASVASGSPVIEIYNPDPTKQGPYPYFPYNVYGSPTGVAPTAPNPMAWLDYAKSGTFGRTNNFIGNVYLLLQPIKGLTFRSSFGINSFSTSDRSWVPAYLLSATSNISYFSNPMDITAQATSTCTKWIFDNTLNYRFSVSKEHNFDVLAGMAAEKSGIGESLSGDNGSSLFNSFENAYLINNRTIDPSFTHLSGQPLVSSRILSGFGRLTYDYKQKYLFTAVARTDGSSNFASDKRWGFFPSVSAGWAVTNEPFMQATNGWLDFLKIRASWGQNGNQSISPFQYLSTISFSGAPFYRYSDRTRFINGGYPNILPNPDVSWETSVQTDIGADVRLFKNKLGLTFDWYNKLTKDWLIQAPILATDGTGAPYINGGDVQNRGYEIGVTWNERLKDFSYGLTVNFSQLKNEVTSIANPEGIIHGPNGTLHADQKESYRAEVGKPLGYFWGLQSNGIFQNAQEVLDYKNKTGTIIQPGAKPGDMRYVDRDENGVINQGDYTMLGDPNPNFIFGITANCSYKGFDLSAVANGVGGNQVIWNYFNNNNHGTYNWSVLALDRWHGEGTSNTTPRINTGSTQDITLSDRFVSDASFLRLSNLTLGYDLKQLLRTLPLQQLRFYISGQNLVTFTDYKGFNPEVGNGGKNGGNWAGGVDSSPYPVARAIIFGASLKF